METTSATQGRLPSTLKLVPAAKYFSENPFSLSTLRSVSRGLSNLRESDTAAEQYVSQGILDVLPSVLRQSSKKAVILGLEVLGGLSLSSQSVHHLVLTKKEIIYALVEKFTSSDIKLLTAACHALEDVLITPESLELVKESLLVENLLRMVCLLADLSCKAHAGLRIDGDNLFHESAHDRRQVLLVSERKKTLNCQHGDDDSEGVFCSEVHMHVHTGVRIIGNLLPYQNLKNVPKSVYLKALNILQQHWLFLLEEDQGHYEGVDPSTWNWYKKPKSRREVAKCLMILGMQYDCFSFNNEEKSPGIAEVSSLDFRERFWERCPVLVTKSMPPCLVSFAKSYNTLENLLNNLLSRFTSCPSASADQLDSSMYFHDLECSLGDPLIYGRDIRIVKTVNDIVGKKSNESEVHFLPAEPESSGTHFVHPKAMVKAVVMGFSLAIKGLELRCPDIATLANAIAKQFGQASVGVNLYVTPSNAQGLAVHFDDHCVLVCQLQGHKSWRIFPPVQLLPRLYDSGYLDEEALKDCIEEKVTLQEGHVLYIPRGYPHKAFCEIKPEEKSDGEDLRSVEKTGPYFGPSETLQSDLAVLSTSADPFFGRNKKQKIVPSCSDSSGGEVETSGPAADDRFSVHLTFGVEVEPPFEWEGLVHIALRLWFHERWRNVPVADSDTGKEELCEALLHVSIRNLGDMNIRFRKACMIAAEAPPCLCPGKLGGSSRKENGGDEDGDENGVSTCGALDPPGCESCSESSLEYFQGLIATVNEKCSFSEALKIARSYLNNGTGEVDIICMEWLRHVSNTDERFKDLGTSDPIRLLQQSNLEKLACEKTFTSMKAEFGQALMFHDASKVFRLILDQYSSTRKKIRNGMLALHGGLSAEVYYITEGSY